jgi:inosine-uridine nucleoside N-ribohydrolase
MIPVLIDCDPGQDDALALLLALASPELEVLGVTAVAGNQTLERTTANALRVLELAGRSDVPVASGADRPLVRELIVAADAHGESGLDGPALPPPTARQLEEHAIDFLARQLTASERPPTLVALGPLTNVALLLARHPEAAARIERIVLMGGAIAGGNMTPSAEYNVWVDPEAAARVFESGLDLTMVGLDVTNQAVVTAEHAERLRGAGPIGDAVAAMLEFYGDFYRRVYEYEGAPVHDAVVIAHLVRPGLVTTVERNVVVETGSGLGRGRTVVDMRRRRLGHAAPTAHVAIGIEVPGFVDLLLERLAAPVRAPESAR